MAVESTQSTIQRVLEAISQAVKRLELTADHSTLSSTKAKNNGANTAPVHLHGVVLNYE
jgi:bisphosphoglycerate-independent phosphoglycerate mutase (AlkP superfamily)